MLDLKVLEALVDEALANENESTLVEWLSEQRNANLSTPSDTAKGSKKTE